MLKFNACFPVPAIQEKEAERFHITIRVFPGTRMIWTCDM